MSNVEGSMDVVHKELEKLPDHLKQFTIAMRALYAEKAVGGDEEELQQFRKIRNRTRDDALVFLEQILPLSETNITGLRDYCNYYQSLTFDDWRDDLDDIIKEVSEHKDNCVLLIELVKNLMEPMTKREDEAKILSPTFENLKKEYDEKRQDLDEKTSGSFGSYMAAFGGFGGALLKIATITPLGLFGKAILDGVADKKVLAKSLAYGEQARVHDQALLCITETLIPAIKNFLESLEAVSGFFTVIKSDLVNLRSRGEKAVDDPKMRHYKMMKRTTVTIENDCRAYLMVVPKVGTDLEVLPRDDMNKNYVDNWLEARLREVEEAGKAKMFNNFKLVCGWAIDVLVKVAASHGINYDAKKSTDDAKKSTDDAKKSTDDAKKFTNDVKMSADYAKKEAEA